MKTLTEEDRIFEFGEIFTTGILCNKATYKPFKVREALALVQKLGRPLTDDEIIQFERE